MCSSRTSRTWSRFWRKMGTHMSAEDFARRTVEPKPELASSKIRCSSFSFSSTVNARAKLAMWLMWLT